MRKILLDEGMPRPLKRCFPDGVQALTTQEAGWGGTRNGNLLRLAAEAGFECVLTMDQGMATELNQDTLPLPVILLFAYQKELRELGYLIASRVMGILDGATASRVYSLDARRRDLLAEAVKAQAEQGDAFAQASLGRSHYHGEGVPRDEAEAGRWYRKAAEQGDAEAQHALASLYAKGQGLPQDDTEARKWYQLAADQGHPIAWHDLRALQDRGR